MPERQILGVLGGMGPLASAAFVQTVYRLNPAAREQDLPRVLLDSMPAFPDRTEAIRSGRDTELVRRLDTHLRRLVEAGAEEVVVACFTAHHFLPRLAPELLPRVRSLIDQTVHALAARDGRYLLLCTDGTRQARVFPRHPCWPEVADRVVWPDDGDQRGVHRMLYRMKQGGALTEAADLVSALRSRYRCTGVILGCTELHLVGDRLVERLGGSQVLDPLREIALSLWTRTAQPLLAA
ncbi:aspartate/glutamate racemase family protein [Micromonospora sp. R77]|uniref:aspartate/glutamate racemase family protein n=1 Tax=Micromonospora sp. R77 TaxID=2925836 RepID=UPI001F5FFD6E|nr:aspartate/glutamate racemase family protein [Micromonospora sp. R77]MCI4065658.1 aspartate/glutamate racemase family protein [Micromonospora sp. R77]